MKNFYEVLRSYENSMKITPIPQTNLQASAADVVLENFPSFIKYSLRILKEQAAKERKKSKKLTKLKN